MSDDNGNHEKPSRTPLERVKERIAARIVEERGSGVMASIEEVSPDDDGPTSDANDPLYAWKRREDGTSPSLEQLHSGLVAVAEISEAAIEGGINMAADLHKALPAIDKASVQIGVIAAKTEANSKSIDEVDEDLSKLSKTVHGVRKSVQAMQVDIDEIKAHTRQIPAIKEMLGEIIARLPDPSEPKTKTRRKRKTA